MQIRASEFRKNLFTLIDRCIATGEQIEVIRRTGKVRIIPVTRRLPIAGLPRRPGTVVDGNSLDSFSPAEWHPQ